MLLAVQRKIYVWWPLVVIWLVLLPLLIILPLITTTAWDWRGDSTGILPIIFIITWIAEALLLVVSFICSTVFAYDPSFWNLAHRRKRAAKVKGTHSRFVHAVPIGGELVELYGYKCESRGFWPLGMPRCSAVLIGTYDAVRHPAEAHAGRLRFMDEGDGIAADAKVLAKVLNS